MKSELDTLFLPFESGLIDYPRHNTPVLFANARYHDGLKHFETGMICQQVFKPYAADLENKGLKVIADPSGIPEQAFGAVLLLATKNQRESENILARSTLALQNGGVIAFSADNKSGGTRVKNMLVKLGFTGIGEHSKNKARVVWAVKDDTSFQESLARQWVALDEPKEITGGFVSRLGLYGWNKIDKGSEVLAAHLPRDIKGKGADFGCGYGYLSKTVLETCRKAKSVDYIDADFRAIELCQRNLEGFEAKMEGFWMDLAAPDFSIANKYDWIVMNPPFHEGKKSDSDIGVAFIKNAYASLRRKGVLYMVANNQLPYERVLSEIYFESAMIAQGGGFKVFRAVK